MYTLTFNIKTQALIMIAALNPVISWAVNHSSATIDEASQWYNAGKSTIASNLKTALSTATNLKRPAKNIILFIGDGMGVSTVTAARIYEGQLKGSSGEENSLFFENFPYLALSKTYNTNQQTPDSAGTMTAIVTGVKTKAGVISVGPNVTRGDCSTLPGNRLTTAMEHAEHIGMSTGIVTTTRVTHATPAANYAHVVERDFEDDHNAKDMTIAKDCIDIARQLIDFQQHYGNGLDIVLGGGKRSFLPNDEQTQSGMRLDGRNLTTEWLAQYRHAAYVTNQQQLAQIDVAKIDHLLGLFNPSHLQYEMDRRENKNSAEPTLTQMTETAIQILQKNPKGFFLQVEAGRIDHAHHAGNAIRALVETIELSNAVRRAYQLAKPEETLIIVTADHSHVFTISGYPTRGNPILGKVVGNDRSGRPKNRYENGEDGLPYTTLGYINGQSITQQNSGVNERFDKPVAAVLRSDLSHVNTEAPGFHQQSLIPLPAETHGGEDVAVYATGPGASLLRGTIEQNVIFHIMDEAAQLSERSQLPSIQ